MSRFRRVEIFEPCYPPSLFVRETSIFTPKLLSLPSFVFDEEEVIEDLSLALGFVNPKPSPFELFDSVADLIRVEKTPSPSSYKRIEQRVKTDLLLQTLSDKVSALESKFDQLANGKKDSGGDRKYTLTAEVKGPVERRYKWTTEIKDGKKKEEKRGGGVEKNYKWTTEIKDDGKKKEEKRGGGVEKNYKWTAEFKGKLDNGGIPILRKFTFEASNGDNAGEHSKSEKKDKKKEECATRLVEIEDPTDDGALVLRRAFAKRVGAQRNNKGKRKELSPQDAALLIQMTFRAYLIRRSQALRALRELAIAKAKLKEIRASFNNFSYRRYIARDAEERQKFTEKIIVLLLTVDAIEGSDLMVRAAKRSMVDELEAMLDVVDPEPAGKSGSMRRRTFDMPDGAIRKEISEGVANIVHLLDVENTSSNFEACL